MSTASNHYFNQILVYGKLERLYWNSNNIYEIDVDGEYIVDTGHIVAFENTLDYRITKVGDSWIGAFLGGEGLICRFQGRGKVYCQTHNARSFGRLIGSQLPPR